MDMITLAEKIVHNYGPLFIRTVLMLCVETRNEYNGMTPFGEIIPWGQQCYQTFGEIIRPETRKPQVYRISFELYDQLRFRVEQWNPLNN